MATGGNPNPNPGQPRPQQPPPGGSPATPHTHMRPPSMAGAHYQGLFHSPPSHNPAFQIHMGASSTPQTPLMAAAAAAASAKRPPQKPPSRPPAPTSAAAAASVAAAYKAANSGSVDLTPAARRNKKRKLPEKQLPDRVAALLPESALYTQLLEFEARVDAALARKKVDIQEALKTPPSLQRTLRIYVFNTFANQAPRTIPPPKAAEPPTWSLKIIGRVLEDGAELDPAGVVPKHNPMYPKFSSFFKRVTIGLDPSLYPENSMITWENARSAAPQEGFEVKRKGDKEFLANIRLEMNYNPEKFKLSQPLMEVLGVEVDTRARVIAALWQYIKAKKLQNPSDPSYFMCDPQLKKVFGEEKMRFAMLSQKISQHLAPPPPINFEHKIKLSGNGANSSACYDILVDVPFPLQKEMTAFLANTEKHKDIEACDEVISASIKKIHEHRRRRAFFLGFSQSPVEFINALIASQSKDLKLVAGEANRNIERERRADFYNQPWVEDAVIRYLNRKPPGGNDGPGAGGS
ncbi:SWI/SNF complex component SNF12 homolog [Lolium rigidum]|uniref:SWI/SNF complex component SNF12 homolog n=1 Tax=Lolium rigidum TaxID=89674 RepID=UPI001F5D5656|nr:SWI/SNF complex component SNF12 homolog [Lolium rigidum]